MMEFETIESSDEEKIQKKPKNHNFINIEEMKDFNK